MNKKSLCVFVVSALCLVLSGCGAEAELDGSIRVSHTLRFDRLQVRQFEDTILIEYVRDQQLGLDKVAKLTVSIPDPGMPSYFVSQDEFEDAVELSRVVADGSEFPPVQYGRLNIDRLESTPSGYINGTFDVVFNNGHTLHGVFDTSVDQLFD